MERVLLMFGKWKVQEGNEMVRSKTYKSKKKIKSDLRNSGNISTSIDANGSILRRQKFAVCMQDSVYWISLLRKKKLAASGLRRRTITVCV